MNSAPAATAPSHVYAMCRITFFVVNYFMIVVAPVFFAASIYLALGRIIRVSGRRVSPLGPRAVLSIFLTFDVITIIMQVAGAGWIGAAENNGGDITVRGHCVQLHAFVACSPLSCVQL